MLCKKCMIAMKPGTSYEHKKGGKFSTRRYYECKKCSNRIYTKEPNFQEYMNKATEKSENR